MSTNSIDDIDDDNYDDDDNLLVDDSEDIGRIAVGPIEIIRQQVEDKDDDIDVPLPEIVAREYGGFKLNEKYDSKGGLGLLYKVQKISSKKFFALKYPKKKKYIENMEKELDALSKMDSHDHIVNVILMSTWNNIPFFIMPWAHGRSLDTWLYTYNKDKKTIDFNNRENAKIFKHVSKDEDNNIIVNNQSLNDMEYEARIVVIMTQIIQGLDHAHKYGIIHADIKPQNILLMNSSFYIKLCDFNISVDDSKVKQADIKVYTGTRGYRSPEQVKLRANPELISNLTDKTDSWSLGLIILELITKCKCSRYIYNLDGDAYFDTSALDGIDGYSDIQSKDTIFFKTMMHKFLVEDFSNRFSIEHMTGSASTQGSSQEMLSIKVDTLLSRAKFQYKIKSNQDEADKIFQELLEIFNKSIPDDESKMHFYHEYGFYLLNVKKNIVDASPIYEQCRSCYDNWKKICLDDEAKLKSNVSILYSLGHFALQEGSVEKAEDVFNECLKIDSTHVQTLNTLGFLLRDIKKEHGEAADMFRRALSSNPHHVPSMHNLGELLMKSSSHLNLSEARSLLVEAKNLEPDHEGVRVSYAELLVRESESGKLVEAEKIDEAWSILNDVLNKNPYDISALVNTLSLRNLHLLSLDDTERALEQIEAALTKHPSHQRVRDLIDIKNILRLRQVVIEDVDLDSIVDEKTLKERVTIYRDCLQTSISIHGDNSSESLSIVRVLSNAHARSATLLVDQRRLSEAAEHLTTCLELRRKGFGDRSVETLGALVNLSACYYNLRSFEKANPLLTEYVEKYSAGNFNYSDRDDKLPNVVSRFADCRHELKKCFSLGCANSLTRVLKCPKCNDPPGFFCSQDCFKANYKQHKRIFNHN